MSLGVSRYVQGHQHTARTSKTWTPLKVRHCTTPVSNFVVRRTESQILFRCIVKRSRINGRRAGSPYCLKHWRTVQAGAVSMMLISWLVVLDIVIRFWRSDFTLYLSFHMLIRGRLWDSAWSLVWPSSTHSVHIRLTMVGYRPVQRVMYEAIFCAQEGQWFYMHRIPIMVGKHIWLLFMA